MKGLLFFFFGEIIFFRDIARQKELDELKKKCFSQIVCLKKTVIELLRDKIEKELDKKKIIELIENEQEKINHEMEEAKLNWQKDGLEICNNNFFLRFIQN